MSQPQVIEEQPKDNKVTTMDEVVQGIQQIQVNEVQVVQVVEVVEQVQVEQPPLVEQPQVDIQQQPPIVEQQPSLESFQQQVQVEPPQPPQPPQQSQQPIQQSLITPESSQDLFPYPLTTMNMNIQPSITMDQLVGTTGTGNTSTTTGTTTGTTTATTTTNTNTTPIITTTTTTITTKYIQPVIDILENNNENIEEMELEPVQEPVFQPKNKFASIVISDEDDDPLPQIIVKPVEIEIPPNKVTTITQTSIITTTTPTVRPIKPAISTKLAINESIIIIDEDVDYVAKQEKHKQEDQQQQLLKQIQGQLTLDSMPPPPPEDDNMVQDMDLLQEWSSFSQLSEVVGPKFQGVKRRMEFNLDFSHPKAPGFTKCNDIIKAFWGENRFKLMLEKIGTTECEFWNWLGIKLTMGYMRLPEQADYFLRESWLAGSAVPSVISQEGYEFIDQRVDIVQQQATTSLLVKLESNQVTYFFEEFVPELMAEMNEKFRKALQPGQELVLMQNQSLMAFSNKIEWYQLIDRESGFILHQFFWNVPDKKNITSMSHKNLQKRLRKMFEPYHLNRHIVYSQGILDAESVILLLSNKIFICTELHPHSLLPASAGSFYKSKQKEPLCLVQRQQWVSFVSQHSLTQRSTIIQATGKMFLDQEKFYILPAQVDDLSNTQILFPFVMESIIHNLGSLSKVDNFKKFRAGLADYWTGYQMNYGTTKRKDIKIPVQTFDVQCQTTQTLGVKLDKLIHCPVHDGNARCLVCLKQGVLSKTTASCLGCSQGLNHKIFICIYPCFRQFHLNPKEYLNDGEYFQISMGYEQFDADDDQDDNHLPLKPDTTELDQLYAKNHQDMDEELLQYAIPINYEDDYRHKTKFKIIHSKRPAPHKRGNRGGRVGRPIARVDGTGGGGEQSEDQHQQSETQKKGRPKKKTTEPQELDAESNKNAMMDFFQQVRKKVMATQKNT